MLLRARVLDIEKIAKDAEDRDEGDKVKGPSRCMDELISSQQ
jgi:hypothetical protein